MMAVAIGGETAERGNCGGATTVERRRRRGHRPRSQVAVEGRGATVGVDGRARGRSRCSPMRARCWTRCRGPRGPGSEPPTGARVAPGGGPATAVARDSARRRHQIVDRDERRAARQTHEQHLERGAGLCVDARCRRTRAKSRDASEPDRRRRSLPRARLTSRASSSARSSKLARLACRPWPPPDRAARPR